MNMVALNAGALVDATALRRGQLCMFLFFFCISFRTTLSSCVKSLLETGRKHRVRRSIRVPAISNKVADIPPDDYSWRKYGQKPIKGSPYPRYINFLITLLEAVLCIKY